MKERQKLIDRTDKTEKLDESLFRSRTEHYIMPHMKNRKSTNGMKFACNYLQQKYLCPVCKEVNFTDLYNAFESSTTVSVYS